jgi:hypothetical protein
MTWMLFLFFIKLLVKFKKSLTDTDYKNLFIYLRTEGVADYCSIKPTNAEH